MYDPKSLKAEEFINHDEILATLDYAEKNKHNAELIDQIIAKAKLWKGLTHREASVLLACDLPDRNDLIFKLAEQLKKDFYGNRIVFVRAAVPVELLRERVRVLPLSHQKQAYPPQKTDAGANPRRSHRFARYGTQASGIGSGRRPRQQPD